MDNTCHRKRNDYKIDMAIDTFWHESICLFLYKEIVDYDAVIKFYVKVKK